MKDQAARAAAGKAVAGLWARLQEALSGLLIEIRWRVCTRVHSQLQLDSLLEVHLLDFGRVTVPTRAIIA